MTEISTQIARQDVETLGLAGYLGTDQGLRKFVFKLGQANIETVGDLAKYSADSLFRAFPTTPTNRKKIVSHLSAIGGGL
jgi:hypothetical protein